MRNTPLLDVILGTTSSKSNIETSGLQTGVNLASSTVSTFCPSRTDTYTVFAPRHVCGFHHGLSVVLRPFCVLTLAWGMCMALVAQTAV